MTVVLDAMGGDGAPGVAVHASRLLGRDLAHLLVGEPSALRGAVGPVHPARDAVAMTDDVAKAVRGRPETSIRVAARLLAAGQADALVSAGSTGATVAAARLDVGRLAGVRQPVLAARVPLSDDRHLVLLDAGAVPRARGRELVEHARLGRAYARALGLVGPRVGLLSMAAEAGKGPRPLRVALSHLQGQEGFVGPVEPAAALAGAVDVLVTDGWSGNLLLKTLEVTRGADARSVGAGVDHAALLVGVRAPVLVAHGAVDADDLAAAVRFAAELVDRQVVERLVEALADDADRAEAPT